MPHGQQQFCSARVNGRFIAIVPKHLRGFGDVAGLMDFKTRERGHALVFGARVLRARVFCAGGFGGLSLDGAEDIFRAAGGCAFFSCNAFHTRSGVSGSLRMRTPAAWYSAFARHAPMGFTEPSPPPFAP